MKKNVLCEKGDEITQFDGIQLLLCAGFLKCCKADLENAEYQWFSSGLNTEWGHINGYFDGVKKDHVTISAEQILDFRFHTKKLWYLCTVFRHRYI